MRKNKILIVIFILSFFLTLPVSAAILSFDPVRGEYSYGESFAVDVRIDLDNGCINTVDAYIGFPKDKLNVVDFLVGESILNLWVERPTKEDIDSINAKGVLHFSGGIPGGYCGKIPGDPGQSNVLGRIIFRVPSFLVGKEDDNTINLNFHSDTRALLNDGFGTDDIVSSRDAIYKIVSKKDLPPEEWKLQISRDKIAPEPFVIELHKNPHMFNGRYYIEFFTVDKQSGLDHYEVLEIKPEEQVGEAPYLKWWEKLFKKQKPTPRWVTAEIPFVLKDQTLSSIIKVKAVDKAGNERLVEYVPTKAELDVKPVTSATSKSWVFVLLLSIIVLIIILFIIIYKRNKNNKLIENNYEEEE